MGIGEALAEARSQAGLTVAEVSRRTRIRETIIRGIESDDYSACRGDFYARGNIRSIAKVVGADAEPLIREYDEVHRAPGAWSAVSLDELSTPVQRSRWPRVGWVLALALAFGFVGYVFVLLSLHAAGAPPAAAGRKVTHAGRSSAPDHSATVAPTLRPTVLTPTPTPIGPTATVHAYVAAINGHDYARAWSLGGRKMGASYPSFVSGFDGTARDTLTIVSVSGDVVTARLTARQTDGTIDTYQGTYTVRRGVIIESDVRHLG